MQRELFSKENFRLWWLTKKLFHIVNSLIGHEKHVVYPQHTDSLCRASVINIYFVTKMADIRKEFPDLEVNADQLSITDIDIFFDYHVYVFSTSHQQRYPKFKNYYR